MKKVVSLVFVIIMMMSLSLITCQAEDFTYIDTLVSTEKVEDSWGVIQPDISRFNSNGEKYPATLYLHGLEEINLFFIKSLGYEPKVSRDNKGFILLSFKDNRLHVVPGYNEEYPVILREHAERIVELICDLKYYWMFYTQSEVFWSLSYSKQQIQDYLDKEVNFDITIGEKSQLFLTAEGKSIPIGKYEISFADSGECMVNKRVISELVYNVVENH